MQSAIPTGPAHEDPHPSLATTAAAASIVIRLITREVSYTLSRSFIVIGDNVHTCLGRGEGGGGGGGGVVLWVIVFGDVGLFWCLCVLFLSYSCAFLL